MSDSGEVKGMRPALAGFAALLVAIGIGRFGYPPLIPSIIQHGWFTVAEADYLGAMNLAGYVVGSALASRINRRIGARTLVISALAVVLLTFVGCAFPLGFPIYALLRTLAGLAGGLVMVVAAPTILARIAPERRGAAGGIIFAGVGAGIALSGTLIPLLVRRGLTITWWSYIALAAVMIVVAARELPRPARPLPRAPLPEPLSEPAAARRGAARTMNRTVLLLMASYACNAIGFVPHTVFWVDFIARGLGLGVGLGNRMWVLLGIAAAVGPPMTGLLADRIGFARSLRVSLLVKGIGVLLPVFFSSIWALALSSICTGSLALGITSLAAGRVSELVPADRQKQVWGWMTMAFSVAHAATAYLLTFIFSGTGSYSLLFIIGAVTLLVGSLLDYASSKSVARVPSASLA